MEKVRTTIRAKMKALKPQTTAEGTALTKALSAMREEWNFPPLIDLQWLVKSWYRFVREIKAGYDSHPVDYVHFLDLRDELDRLSATLPDRMQRAIAEVLRPADEEYLLITDTTDEPLLPPDESEHLHERWYRLPKLLKGEFLEAWHRPKRDGGGT